MFYVLVGISGVFGIFMFLSWFFNAEIFNRIYKHFWLELTIFGMIHLYILPGVIYTNDPKAFVIFQNIYFIMIGVMCIIMFGKGVMHYRTKYILVKDKE